MANVLVIDDDRSVPFLIERAVQGTGVTVLPARSVQEGLELLERRPDVVLLDIMLPEGSGLEAVRKIQDRDPKLPIIFITAGGTSDTTIEAMKLGAYDYLLKPLDLPKLRELVERALEIRRLMQVRVELPSNDAPSPDGDHIIGRSPAMCEVFKAVGRVAPQNVTTLIVGESGTGKELVARAIYHHSARSAERFLALNCAALPETLLESELFGHEKGSFTSANYRRIGKFEQCAKGTTLPGRGGGHVPLAAKQDPPRAAGKEVRARGRERDDRDRRAGDRRHQPRLEGDGDQGDLPRGPVLPLERLHHQVAPLAGAGRGHPVPLGAPAVEVRQGTQQAGRARHRAGGAGGPDALLVAGERPRARGGGASGALEHDGERDPTRLPARPGAFGRPERLALGRSRPTHLPAICVPLSTNACGAGRRRCMRPAWR